MVEEACSFAVGTVRIHTSEDAFAEAQVVAGSSFVDRNSTVAHSTRGANSGTHYGTSRVVLVLELLIVVGRYLGPPFELPRRQALIVRNLGSG